MEKYVEMIENAKTYGEIRDILDLAWEDPDLESYTDLLDRCGIQF